MSLTFSGLCLDGQKTWDISSNPMMSEMLEDYCKHNGSLEVNLTSASDYQALTSQLDAKNINSVWLKLKRHKLKEFFWLDGETHG